MAEKQVAYAEKLLTWTLHDIIGGAIDTCRRIVVNRDKRLDEAFEQAGVDNFSDLIEYFALNQKIGGVPISDIIKMGAHDIIEILK